MTRLIIVRHAEASGNVDRIFHGQTNSNITKNGEAQLICLKERFKNIDFDVIYSSDLERAMQTAFAVNNYKKLSINVEKGLREINGGDWENVHFDELSILYPNEFQIWNKELHNLQMPNGESVRSFSIRLKETNENIIKKHKGKTICIVTHGTAIRVLMCFAKKLTIEQIDTVSWCDNSAISIVEYDDNFNPKIMLEGDSSHLHKGLSTIENQDWWILFNKGEKKK